MSQIINEKLDNFKNYIKSKRVAVLGIGISNTPLIKYLCALGVDVTAFDMAEQDKLASFIKELEGLDVKYVLGNDYLSGLKGFDVIFKTPKVRYDIPQLVSERERGAWVTSEMEVFVDLCPAKIIGITGSDGKTTTTTLIYNMIKEEGYNCYLGGNIGIPLLSKIDEIKADDIVVLELSSFQLHTMRKSPHISVITNISPNHLDVHKSMEEYVEAKRNIIRYQSESDIAVLNADNIYTKQFASDLHAKVLWFSRLHCVETGAYVQEGEIIYSDGKDHDKVMDVSDIILPGNHNIENYLAAICAVKGFVKNQTIKKVASTFKGVEHRIEFVRELNGVKYYNDSIGTSPTRTIASINAFNQKVVLIAGGYDKHIPYDEMGAVLVDKTKALILLGATAGKIKQAFEQETNKAGKGLDIPVFLCSSMEEAVQKAAEVSEQGDIVLMSPASASFDMYKNFEERGKHFKDIVLSLKC